MAKAVTTATVRGALVTLIALAAQSATATPVTIDFTGDFGLDLNRTVYGVNFGALLDTTYGSGTGTSSTVSVSGSITFDSATAPYQELQGAGQGVANYLAPVTDASLNFWDTPVRADISGLAASTPSIMQTDVNGSRGCLGFGTECRGTSTGNAALVIDDGLVQIVDINGSQTFTSRDSLGFGLGFTTAETGYFDTYLPSIYQDGMGNDVTVWGMRLSVVGKPGEQLWFSTALPSDPTFFNPENIDYLSISIGLLATPEGNTDNTFFVPLNSIATTYAMTSVDDDSTGSNAVPEPTSLALLMTSGVLLAATRRNRRRPS